jgi:hypothetical protein
MIFAATPLLVCLTPSQCIETFSHVMVWPVERRVVIDAKHYYWTSVRYRTSRKTIDVTVDLATLMRDGLESPL